MPKYKPGDIWTPVMAKVAAKHGYICTITEIPCTRHGRGRYHVDIFNFETITDNMIESCLPQLNVDEILNFL